MAQRMKKRTHSLVLTVDQLQRTSQSLPCSPATQREGTVEKAARARYRSEDLHTRERRFGSSPVSLSFRINETTGRRQLEAVVHMQRVRRNAAPLIVVVEVRKLLFWAVMALLLASAAALKIAPTRGAPRMALPHVTEADVAHAEAAQPREAKPVSELSLRSSIAEEVAADLGKASQSLGADSFDVYLLLSNVHALFSEDGEVTAAKLRAYFSRACLSAMVHKLVGAAVVLSGACFPPPHP